jgi:hypothetical protein
MGPVCSPLSERSQGLGAYVCHQRAAKTHSLRGLARTFATKAARTLGLRGSERTFATKAARTLGLRGLERTFATKAAKTHSLRGLERTFATKAARTLGLRGSERTFATKSAKTHPLTGWRRHSAVLDWHSDKRSRDPTPSSLASDDRSSQAVASQAPAVVGATLVIVPCWIGTLTSARGIRLLRRLRRGDSMVEVATRPRCKLLQSSERPLVIAPLASRRGRWVPPAAHRRCRSAGYRRPRRSLRRRSWHHPAAQMR